MHACATRAVCSWQAGPWGSWSKEDAKTRSVQTFGDSKTVGSQKVITLESSRESEGLQTQRLPRVQRYSNSKAPQTRRLSRDERSSDSKAPQTRRLFRVKISLESKKAMSWTTINVWDLDENMGLTKEHEIRRGCRILIYEKCENLNLVYKGLR